MLGKVQSFDVSASVAYPNGKGRWLRFSDGYLVRTTSALGNAFRRSLTFFGVLAGHIVWMAPARVKIQLPERAAPELPARCAVTCRDTLETGRSPYSEWFMLVIHDLAVLIDLVEKEKGYVIGGLLLVGVRVNSVALRPKAGPVAADLTWSESGLPGGVEPRQEQNGRREQNCRRRSLRPKRSAKQDCRRRSLRPKRSRGQNVPTPLASSGAVGASKTADAARFERSGRRKHKPPSGKLPDRAWRFGPTAALSGRGDQFLGDAGRVERSGRHRRHSPGTRCFVTRPRRSKQLADTPPALASGERTPTPVASTEAVGTDESCRTPLVDSANVRFRPGKNFRDQRLENTELTG